MSEDRKSRANNKFVRGLIFVYIVVLLYLVFINFYKNASPFEFSTGLITVLLIITILILSEAFDNLSLGKLFTLSREVQQKEKEVEEAKEENKALRENIISLASVVTQNQSNHTYIGLQEGMLPNLGVVKAKTEELEDNSKVGEIQDEKTNQKNEKDSSVNDMGGNLEVDKNPIPDRSTNRLIRTHTLEEGLNKFIANQEIPLLDVVKNVEFSSSFKEADPIGDQRVIFDAYYKTPRKEFFIEAIISDSMSASNHYRIYTLIAKIFFYQQLKNTPVEMILVLINFPESFSNGKYPRSSSNGEYLLKRFQPAIANRLLRIESIDFSEKEMEEILKKIDPNNN